MGEAEEGDSHSWICVHKDNDSCPVTAQATHLDHLSDFLAPQPESQGIFVHQCCSVQPFLPSVKNKAHQQGHTLGDRSVTSFSPDNVQI